MCDLTTEEPIAYLKVDRSILIRLGYQMLKLIIASVCIVYYQSFSLINESSLPKDFKRPQKS